MISIYIAARWQDRDRAKAMAKMLTNNGFKITSGWLGRGGLATHHKNQTFEEANRIVAKRDIRDLQKADILVALLPKKYSKKGTGGRHFEFGFAFATYKPIVIVGHRSNVFHYLPRIDQIDRLGQLVNYLKSGIWKKQIRG